MKIQSKLIVLFSFLAVVPILIIGVVSYINAKDALEKQALNTLEAVACSRVSNIRNMLHLRQEMAKVIAGTYEVRQLESNGDNDPQDIALIQSEIESILTEVLLQPTNDNEDIAKAAMIDIIGVWDVNGQIVANTNKELIGQKMPDEYLQGVKDNETFFGGFRNDPLTGKDYLIFVQSVRDYEDEKFAGAVLFKAEPHILNEITSDRTGLGETGEVYLVNKDYYMITESRFIEDAILNQKVETETAKKCFASEETLGIYPDYRGISIVGSTKYLKDLGWCLFSEIDKEEAFAPVYALRIRISIIGIIVLCIAVALGYFIARFFTRPIKHLTEVAAKVEAGDLSQRAEGITDKELGALAGTFNSMVQKIENYNKELETDLAEKSLYLDNILRSATEYSIATTDLDFRITYFNPMAEELYGVTAEEVIGKTIKDIHTMNKVASERFEKAIENVKSKGEHIHIYDRKTDERTIYIESRISGILGSNGELIGFANFSRDITKQKEAEEAIRKSEDNLVRAQKVGMIGSWFLDLAKNELLWSDENYRIFGIPKGTPMTYETFIEVVHPEDRVFVDKKWTAAINKEPYDIEHRLLINDKVKWVREKAELNYDKEGNPLSGIGITHDITERKKIEDKIKKLNEELEDKVIQRTAELQASNKELEAFSYSVSHDLRAPLTRMDGFSKALQNTYSEKLDEQGAHYLNRIRASSTYMAGLIDDLLTLSRITRRKMEIETVDLSVVAEKVINRLKNGQKDRKVEATIQENLLVRGDAGLMKVMIENLLGNAWKYSGKEKNAKIEFGKTKQKDKSWLFVKDNGIGFDMKYYDKLFTPFQRLHSDKEFEGTGIGLSTVQRIISKHGGQIHAESEPGKGATFYFTLMEH